MTSRCSLKRINKEIENYKTKSIQNYPNGLKNFFNNTTIQQYIINNCIEDEYFLEIKNDNKLFLNLKIPKNYPFEPYIVYNNYYICYNKSISYYKYINNIFDNSKTCDYEILNFFYLVLYEKDNKYLKNKIINCYCCNSFTCKNNWNPGLTVNDITIEYLQIKFIEKYSKKYNYKLLENLYNKLFYKLSNDIIYIIISFLYI